MKSECCFAALISSINILNLSKKNFCINTCKRLGLQSDTTLNSHFCEVKFDFIPLDYNNKLKTNENIYSRYNKTSLIRVYHMKRPIIK